MLSRSRVNEYREIFKVLRYVRHKDAVSRQTEGVSVLDSGRQSLVASVGKFIEEEDLSRGCLLVGISINMQGKQYSGNGY